MDPMGGPPQLVASGGVRSCNPERIVLKKIVLTGGVFAVDHFD
jgi:hypothetical protein